MKRLVISIVIIIAAICISVFYFMNTQATTQETTKTGLETKLEALLGEPIPEKRPLYFDEEIQETVFSKLPEMPNDFYQVRTMLLYNMLRFDPEKINESYWKQPEWFPNYKTLVVPLIQNAKENRRAIWCVGVYPARDLIVLERNEDVTEGYTEITRYMWVRSAPLVEQVIGVKSNPIYPQHETLEASEEYGTPGMEVYQDPSMAQEYIDISTDLDEFILTPNFPIYTEDYVKMIEVTIRIRNDIPEGKYVVGLDFGGPSGEFTEENLWKYKLHYTDPNVGMSCGSRESRIFIQVR